MLGLGGSICARRLNLLNLAGLGFFMLLCELSVALLGSECNLNIEFLLNVHDSLELQLSLVLHFLIDFLLALLLQRAQLIKRKLDQLD